MIGLEAVIIGTIGTIPVGAPVVMGVAVAGPCWRIGDRPTDDCTTGKSGKRIPPAIIVATITGTMMPVTFMALPVAGTMTDDWWPWTEMSGPVELWRTRTMRRSRWWTRAVAITMAILNFTQRC